MINFTNKESISTNYQTLKIVVSKHHKIFLEPNPFPQSKLYPLWMTHQDATDFNKPHKLQETQYKDVYLLGKRVIEVRSLQIPDSSTNF